MSEQPNAGQCGCAHCRDRQPYDGNQTRPSRRIMVVCEICGNKRCPHATWHIHNCTGSNASDQPGSSFGPDRIEQPPWPPQPNAAPAAPAGLTEGWLDRQRAESQAFMRDFNELLRRHGMGQYASPSTPAAPVRVEVPTEPGWYECEYICGPHRYVLWWDGEMLKNHPTAPDRTAAAHQYKNFKGPLKHSPDLNAETLSLEPAPDYDGGAFVWNKTELHYEDACNGVVDDERTSEERKRFYIWMRARACELERVCAAIRSRAERAEARVAELEGDLNNISNGYDVRDDDARKAQAEVARLTAENAKLKAELERVAKSLECDIEHVWVCATAAKCGAKIANHDCDVLRDENAKLRARVEELEAYVVNIMSPG